MKIKIEELMEIVCDNLCMHPENCSDQDELAQICEACPLENYLLCEMISEKIN
ncbi:MAG: hypothetical protein PHY47_25850 [Lachnospiraceae bacterium]|nr:hypothetical protein [Lachnospiraceae bacterium]